MIIRAHQSIKKGIQSLFKEQIVTVFSASNYCGEEFNQCGVLMLKESGNLRKQFFDYFEYLRRSKVHFNDNVLSNNLMSTILPNYRRILEKKGNCSSQVISPNQKTRKHLIPQDFIHFLIFKN
jgi:hypothetical protein